MILRENLAKLLAKQDIGKQMVWDTLEPEWKREYRANAEEIINLFTYAITAEEFKLTLP